MITTINIGSPFLTRNAYLEQHGENVTIGMDYQADSAIRWALAKMAEEERIKKLAETNPTVANAAEAVKKAEEQLKMVIELVR